MKVRILSIKNSYPLNTAMLLSIEYVNDSRGYLLVISAPLQYNNNETGPTLVVFPVVPWNHLIFDKDSMKPLDFSDVVQ